MTARWRVAVIIRLWRIMPRRWRLWAFLHDDVLAR